MTSNGEVFALGLLMVSTGKQRNASSNISKKGKVVIASVSVVVFFPFPS